MSAAIERYRASVRALYADGSEGDQDVLAATAEGSTPLDVLTQLAAGLTGLERLSSDDHREHVDALEIILTWDRAPRAVTVEETPLGFQMREADGRLGRDAWDERERAEEAAASINSGSDADPDPDQTVSFIEIGEQG
jgi:hypothetical protein